MSDEHEITRRKFLVGSFLASLGLASGGFLMSGCAKKEEATPAAVATTAAAAGKPKKMLKAAFSNAGLQATWCAQGKDTVEQWGKWLGVEITWYDGQLNVDKQRAAIDDMASKDWDFVAIQPLSIGSLVEPVQKMIDKGIPVIDMDTMLAPWGSLKIHTFIAPDNVWMGEQVTQALVDAIGGKGNIIMTQGSLGHTGAQGRAQGFRNVIKKYPNIKVLDESPADWDVNKVAQLWENLLNRYKKIDAAFFHNDDMALAAYQVIKNAGRENEIVIGGIDGMPPAVQAVLDGKLRATARNSAARIHWGALVAGYYAAMQKEVGGKDIPEFILADGPAILPPSKEKSDKPWLLKGYGVGAAAGLLWEEKHFLA